MTPDERDAQAKTRFWLLGLVRLGGVALVAIGTIIASGNWRPLPIALGYALLLAGLVDLTLVTRLLTRRWRTPPNQ